MENAIVLRPILSSTTPHSARLIRYAPGEMAWANLAALFARRRHNGPPWPGLVRLAALCAILLSAGMGARISYAQELPLDRFDVLPMIALQHAALHHSHHISTAL